MTIVRAGTLPASSGSTPKAALPALPWPTLEETCLQRHRPRRMTPADAPGLERTISARVHATETPALPARATARTAVDETIEMDELPQRPCRPRRDECLAWGSDSQRSRTVPSLRGLRAYARHHGACSEQAAQQTRGACASAQTRACGLGALRLLWFSRLLRLRYAFATGAIVSSPTWRTTPLATKKHPLNAA